MVKCLKCKKRVKKKNDYKCLPCYKEIADKRKIELKKEQLKESLQNEIKRGILSRGTAIGCEPWKKPIVFSRGLGIPQKGSIGGETPEWYENRDKKRHKKSKRFLKKYAAEKLGIDESEFEVHLGYEELSKIDHLPNGKVIRRFGKWFKKKEPNPRSYQRIFQG